MAAGDVTAALRREWPRLEPTALSASATRPSRRVPSATTGAVRSPRAARPGQVCSNRSSDVAGEAAVKGSDAVEVEVEVAVKGAIEGEGETHLPGAVAPCPAAAYASSGDRRDKALAARVLRRVGICGLVGVDVSARGRWRRDRKGRRLANEFPRPGRPGSRGIRGDGAGLGSHGSSRPARPDGPLAHALALVGRDLEPARLPCCCARSCGGHRQAAARERLRPLQRPVGDRRRSCRRDRDPDHLR